jgi:large subunit ribosomal protein L9
MKLILKEDYGNLGKVGDVVTVKDGYARNFLIPKKIAYLANDGNVRRLEEEKKLRVVREKKEQRSAADIAAEIEKLSITIPVQVGEDDKLYGSVTSQMIADSLKEKGFEVDKRKIELDEPIKVLGIYTIDIKLHSEVTGKVKVWVVRQ